MLRNMTGKSYSLCFKLKCSTFNRPTFTLNHLNIPNVNQSKNLGIVINETNCNPDFKRQMCKLYANINPNVSGGGQKSTTPSNYQHRIFPFNYIIVRFR